MKAWRFYGFDDLCLDEIPVPEVKSGWVLVIEEMYCGLILKGLVEPFFTYGLGWGADCFMPWQKDILKQKGLR